MKSEIIILGMFGSVLCATMASGDGLRFAFPQDGTWARYDMTGERTADDGTQHKVGGTFTISCVGEVNINGQPCRWIEATIDLKENDLSLKFTEKVLVDAKYLAKGEQPFDHIRKAWSKAVDSFGERVEPMQLGTPQVQGQLSRAFAVFFDCGYDSEEKDKTTVVEGKLGRFTCEGIKATRKQNYLGKDTIDIDEIHVNATCPFGVAAYEQYGAPQPERKSAGSATRKFVIADTGTNAVSEIPDAK